MRNYKCRVLLFLLLLAIFSNEIRAQDPHFSQYNAAPYLLNPSLTGFFNADYKVSGQYRSQWGSFTNGFRTMGAAAELNMLRGKLKDDNFGIGLSFVNDRAGDAPLISNNFAFSIAYRKALGSKIKHRIGIGFQGALLNKRLDASQFLYDSQYDGVEVNPDIPSGESVGDGSGINADLSTGVMWQIIPSKEFNIYFGGAYFHILQPKIDLLNNVGYQYYSRFNVHTGAEIYVNKLLNLLPSIAYYQQRFGNQVNFGSYLQFILEDYYQQPTALSIGAWSRMGVPTADAVIVGARIDFRGFNIGASYDVNISSLKTASKSRGAFELSIAYFGNFTTAGKRKLSIPCPQL
ncbi:MAG: PorP/SprF family type IX secretion system membrane protein [Chitinophagales bacterium]